MAAPREYPILTDEQKARFWGNVERLSERDCWPWTRSLKGRGYGALTINGRGLSAHRVAYELTRGPTRDGLLVYHDVCARNDCCNPAHMTTGTFKDVRQAKKRTFIEPSSRKMPSLEERFWQRINKKGPNGCWVWIADCHGGGYGRLARGDGKKIKAHRLSWKIHNGPIPAGQCVLHKCDNPPCVNPAHLFLGTQLDNIQDMVDKGRHFTASKLTQEDVECIRDLCSKGVLQQTAASRFGVARSTVSHIVNKKRWASKSAKPRRHRGGTSLTEHDVRMIRAMKKAGIKQKDIAARFGVSRPLVSAILSGKRWSHIV